VERLVTAYQESLISLEELRGRMPELRRREKTLQAEAKSIADQTNDRAAYLRLTETLSTFMARLRASAQTLDMAERQRIVRLLVKEVLVGDDTITIRHSIPIPAGNSSGGATGAGSERYAASSRESSLLRKGSTNTPLWRSGLGVEHLPLLHNAGFQPLVDQSPHYAVRDSLAEKLSQLDERDAVVGRDEPRGGSRCGASPWLMLSHQCPHRAGMTSCARLPGQNPPCSSPATGSPERFRHEGGHGSQTV